jgi:peptidoglycan/xylan/chitin deacetylase (PgdA/CDA1 family)
LATHPQTQTPTVSLSFDDGPDPNWTPSLLDELDRLGIAATFFVCAPAAAANPEVVRRIVGAGHEVGFHCTEHVRHSSLTFEQGRIDLEVGLAMLSRLDVHPRRWRTPWGDLATWSEGLAAAYGLEICGWSDDAHDWRGDTAAQMFESLQGAVGPGSVILLHDGIGPGARRADCRETIALVSLLDNAAEELGLELGPIGAVA